jgi:hypothetical protein
MLQRDGMVMVEMEVLVMVVVMMMILMKSGTMAMTMALISPLRKEFPWQIPACRRAFLSLVFSAPQRRRCISLMPPFHLGFRAQRCT